MAWFCKSFASDAKGVKAYASHVATRTDDPKGVSTVTCIFVFDMFKNKIFYFRSQCVVRLFLSTAHYSGFNTKINHCLVKYSKISLSYHTKGKDP